MSSGHQGNPYSLRSIFLLVLKDPFGFSLRSMFLLVLKAGPFVTWICRPGFDADLPEVRVFEPDLTPGFDMADLPEGFLTRIWTKPRVGFRGEHPRCSLHSH